MSAKPGACRDCGKNPAATVGSWYCPECRPRHRRGRRSAAEMTAATIAGWRRQAESWIADRRYSWRAGRVPFAPEDGEGGE